MSVTAGNGVAVQVSVTTALTRVDVASGTGAVLVNSDVDLFLVYDDTLDDTGTVPVSARYRIPAGTSHPAYVTGRRLLIAAKTGTGTAWLVGLPL